MPSYADHFHVLDRSWNAAQGEAVGISAGRWHVGQSTSAPGASPVVSGLCLFIFRSPP